MIADNFIRYMQAEREASPRTVRTYQMALDDFTAYVKRTDSNLEIVNADSDVIRNWVEEMMERGYKPATTLKNLSAVKSMFRYALRKGIVKKDPAHNVTGPKKQKTLPTFLKESEADELFDGLQWDYSSIKDVRSRTLLLLLYTTGIRRAEVIALRNQDINILTREMKVTGKRRKQRIIPLGQELIDAIRLYTELRDRDITPNDDTDAFFINDKGERMSNGQIYTTVRRYLSMVTTQKKRSPHVLRHSFATAMLNHDAKLGSVQKLLGHASLNTTQIYTHVTFEELKRTYTNAHPRADVSDDKQTPEGIAEG